jgi:hypothetical protein
MLLAIMHAGCSPFYVDWDTHSIGHRPSTAVQQAAKWAPPHADVAAPHTQRASVVRQRKHKKPVSSPDMEEMSIQPDTTENSQLPPEGSTISMATPGDSSAAEKAIEATSQKLARFDRNRLSGPTLATFDQANALLNQGKQALAEKDYVAASGFAQKASALADRLQANITAR